MKTRRTRRNKELSLPEILADPIIQAVMSGDGITKDEVERLIGAIRSKLASRQSEARRTGRPVSSAIAFGE
jgi:hypothetical protein